MKQIIEYMIGDWIMVGDTPVQIAAIHQKKVGYHRWEGRLSWVRLDQIKQIPLTPEFLLKNGFIKKGDSYVWEVVAGDGSFNVTLYDDLDGVWGMCVRDYSKFSSSTSKKDLTERFLKVHHVQHEFVLEGVKKEFVM